MTATEQPQAPEPVQPEQPAALAPQPNRILAEPATVQACQQDYAAGAAVRAEMDRQDARRR